MHLLIKLLIFHIGCFILLPSPPTPRLPLSPLLFKNSVSSLFWLICTFHHFLLTVYRDALPIFSPCILVSYLKPCRDVCCQDVKMITHVFLLYSEFLVEWWGQGRCCSYEARDHFKSTAPGIPAFSPRACHVTVLAGVLPVGAKLIQTTLIFHFHVFAVFRNLYVYQNRQEERWQWAGYNIFAVFYCCLGKYE